MADQVYPICVEVGHAIAVEIDSSADGAHQLHHVDGRLPDAVSGSEHRTDWATFERIDLTVAGQIHTAPASWKLDRISILFLQDDLTVGTAPVSGNIERHDGKSGGGHLRCNCRGGSEAAVGEAMPEQDHRVAQSRHFQAWQPSDELKVVGLSRQGHGHDGGRLRY